MALAFLLVVLALAPAATAGPLTWGAEGAVHGDFSTTTNPFFSDDSRRYFPPSASVVGQIRWTGPAGVRFVGGAGYEQRVGTRYTNITLVFGPDTFTLEGLNQTRERSFIVPLEIELPIAAWSLSPGVRWQHVVGQASRIKWLGITSSDDTSEITSAQWEDAEPSVPDRWSATIAIARAWRGDAGTRSVGLRWVHALTDADSDPDIENLHHALQLVLGWSR